MTRFVPVQRSMVGIAAALLTLVWTLGSPGVLPAGAVEDSTAQRYCGGGLLDFLPNPPQDVNEFINALGPLSDENVAYLKSLTRTALTAAEEQDLMDLFDDMAPYLASVHLSTIPVPGAPKGGLLCQTLQANAIIVFSGQNTPEPEKALYAADRCVFLSYGKKKGETQYGDVTYNFDLSKLVRRQHYPWLAEHSATRYLTTFRLGYAPKHLTNTIKMWGPAGAQITDEERIFYTRAIYSHTNLADYAKFNFITHVRLLSASEQKDIYKTLKGVKDRDDLYDQISALSRHHGYLGYPAEVHVDAELPLSTLVDTVTDHGKVVLAGIAVDKATFAQIQSLCPADVARYADRILVHN